MYSKTLYIVIAFGLALSAGPVEAADAPNTAESRLRESLRTVTLQLRTAQTDLAAVQASQAALTEEKKTLAEELAALQKRVAADKGQADKTVAELKSKVSEQTATIAQYREALEKFKAELEKASEAAKIAEAKAAKVGADNVVLARKAADREAKNLALFMISNEILSRYEDFSLGNAIRAKEPFVGRTRTKLENLMQDYQDKISEQRAEP